VEKQEIPVSPSVCVIELGHGLMSKSNFRRGGKGGEWRRQKGFENEVTTKAKLARPKDWPKDDGSGSVAERWGYVVLIVARGLIDTANMAKSITDALQGALFFNDASVRVCSCVGIRQRDAQDATIIVGALPPGSSWAEVRKMGDKLFARYEDLHSEVLTVG
jgi:hypothetical protein